MDITEDVTYKQSDLYDLATEAIAVFGGCAASVVVRFATTGLTPAHDSNIKMLLRETGSLTLSYAAYDMTQKTLAAIFKWLKPKIVKK